MGPAVRAAQVCRAGGTQSSAASARRILSCQSARCSNVLSTTEAQRHREESGNLKSGTDLANQDQTRSRASGLHLPVNTRILCASVSLWWISKVSNHLHFPIQ